MKKKVISLLMISTIILSGCSGKRISSTSSGAVDTASKTSTSSNIQTPENLKPSEATPERADVKTDFKEVKPGIVPQLSAKQKAEVNTKLNSTVNDLSKTLKSIQDAKDIDLNSVN